MSSRLHSAVIVLYSQDVGENPRHCDAEHAARTWMIVDRVLELRGCSERIGRGMACLYLATVLAEHELEETLDALAAEAVRIVTPPFQERVRLLASRVH